MPALDDRASSIKSREEFILFARELLRDLREDPGSWENNDLPSFLEALAAWTEDMDGYYKNQNEPMPEQPSWSMLAGILLAATMYE